MIEDYLPHIAKACSAILFLCSIWYFVRIFNDPKNPLEWWHLVATNRDGQIFASWNQIGQGAGVALSIWMPSIYANSPKMDATGLALVMGTSLLYLGGVSSYAAKLRSKAGGSDVTVTTESSPSSTTTERTVTTKG